MIISAKDSTEEIARKDSLLLVRIQQPGLSRSKFRLELTVLLATQNFLAVLVPLLLSSFCHFRGESQFSTGKKLKEVWFTLKERVISPLK